MKIHLPNYYSRLIEKGTIIIIILKEKFIIILLAEEGISGVSVSGKKQSRGGKGIKKAKKKVTLAITFIYTCIIIFPCVGGGQVY